MASRILEFFGYATDDLSPEARAARETESCPFVSGKCTKTLNDGLVSGVCTLRSGRGQNVICCPQRLYAGQYQVLRDVAEVAFGKSIELIRGGNASASAIKPGIDRIAVFGKKWGGELRLPKRGKTGAYFVDWILARLRDDGNIESFVAVEVQSIDTTGNYREERLAALNGARSSEASSAGFNWENVNKRILPQIIYKGQVLRREQLCMKGLFFVCPTPVYKKIEERLGSNLTPYNNLQTGSLSMMWYDVGAAEPPGTLRRLIKEGMFKTTVDQIGLAFTAPSNLPPENVYEQAIKQAL